MTARDRAAVAENRALAVRLREAGAPYRSIAKQLDVSPTHAYRLVMQALKMQTVEAVEDLRQIEGQRLDAMQAAIWAQAMSGNLRAIDTLIRLSARRARLLGLDVQPDLTMSVEWRAQYISEFDKIIGGLKFEESS